MVRLETSISLAPPAFATKSVPVTIKAPVAALYVALVIAGGVAYNRTLTLLDPEFATVKSNHADFHKIAARIVQRANSGEKVSHELVLGGKSEFVIASAAVVRSLMALKSKVNKPVSV